MRIIYIYLLVCGLMSCNSNQSTPVNLEGYTVTEDGGVQIAEKRDQDNVLSERGYLSNGVKNGVWISYHSGKNAGRIKTISNYTNGKLNGPYLEFSNRGQIEKKVNYLNNVYDGLFATYKNGRAEKEVIYQNGKLNGPYKEYDKRGNLQKVSNYTNDQLDGKVSFFNEEGDLVMEYTYKNGEKISGGIVEPTNEEAPETATK